MLSNPMYIFHCGNIYIYLSSYSVYTDTEFIKSFNIVKLTVSARPHNGNTEPSVFILWGINVYMYICIEHLEKRHICEPALGNLGGNLT